jgi:sterol desaturase/sphingolipid hydroxylase (fatty acid hydroxylase superfamily)
MTDLALPILFMLVFVVGEALILQWQQRHSVDWHDLVFNLNSGHVVLWLFRGFEVAVFGFVSTHASLGLLDNWPALWRWVFALVAWDFCFYWLHRLHHHFALLWAVHVVHHQGEHFNLSLGVRNSWYSSLTSIPFFVILAIIGVPLQVFVTVSILHYSMQLFNHNALTPRLGILEKFFVTPAHHRVHHVKDTAYSNRNFGGTFIFWDKLFGTFSPLPSTPYTYGVGGARSSANPFWASNIPLLQYLRLPVPALADTRRRCRSALMIVTGALALFAAVVGYIYQYGYGDSDITWPQAVLFVLLLLGSVALGGLTEGKPWSLMLWLLVTFMLPALFLGYLHWAQTYWQVPMLVLASHGICVVWRYRPSATRDGAATENGHG